MFHSHQLSYQGYKNKRVSKCHLLLLLPLTVTTVEYRYLVLHSLLPKEEQYLDIKNRYNGVIVMNKRYKHTSSLYLSLYVYP